MNEGRMLIVGAVPLVAGALWLLGLREPEAVAVSLGRARPAQDESTTKLQGAPGAEGFLGVVVAGYTADIGAEVSGSVTEVLASVGTRVAQGDVLLRVDPSVASDDLRASRARLEQQRSEIASAEAELVEASDLVKRLQSIAAGVSDRQLVAAQSREQQMRAAVQQARAGLSVQEAALGQQVTRSGKHTIRAPFEGVVVERFVDPGGLVVPGQLVARVITEDFYVRFAMPPDAARVRHAGERVQVSLPDGDAIVHGTLSDLQPEIDAAAQLVFARARLEVTDALRRSVLPGVRVNVRFAEDPATRGESDATP
jgi:RND family efflux transporter MFP subunit